MPYYAFVTYYENGETKVKTVDRKYGGGFVSDSTASTAAKRFAKVVSGAVEVKELPNVAAADQHAEQMRAAL